MDRFEVVVATPFSVVFSYLHSSMDRFEVASFSLSRSFCDNLHSSMDRFEEVISTINKIKAETFTFQYG